MKLEIRGQEAVRERVIPISLSRIGDTIRVNAADEQGMDWILFSLKITSTGVKFSRHSSLPPDMGLSVDDAGRLKETS